MKILIYGVGGVGGYIAGKLLQNGYGVDICARGKHLEKIKTTGLKIIDNDEEFIVYPDLSTDNPQDFYDVIFICVKGYDLKDSAIKLAKNCHKNTVIIPIANGIANDKKVKEILHKNVVLNSCIYILSNIQEAGIVKRYSNVFNFILSNSHESSQKIYEMFTACKLQTKLSEDIELEVWRKYLFIATFGSLTAFYDKPIGFLMKEKVDEVLQALKEVQLLAGFYGVTLDEKLIQKQIDIAKNIPYESSTSLRLDFQNNNQTEIEELCGFVVKNLEKNGLKSEIFKKVYQKLG